MLYRLTSALALARVVGASASGVGNGTDASMVLVCGGDDGSSVAAGSQGICYWTQVSDDESGWNDAGLSGTELLQVRMCTEAPPKDRSGVAAQQFWQGKCTPMLPVEDPHETCTAGCLNTFCADCDDGQTLYQVWGARLCLATKRCPGTSVKLNLPGGIPEEQCAAKIYHGQAKVCLPWKEECADDWYDCISNGEVSKLLVCGGDEGLEATGNQGICYWTQFDDDESAWNDAGLSVTELLQVRLCTKAPPKDRFGVDAQRFWQEQCAPMLPVEDPRETCTAECLDTYCADCDDGQTIYQVWGARLCLATKRCPGTSVKLSLPGGIPEEQCATKLFNGQAMVCVPWKDECADDWYECISDGNASSPSPILV